MKSKRIDKRKIFIHFFVKTLIGLLTGMVFILPNHVYSQASPVLPLFDFEKKFKTSDLEFNDVRAKIVTEGRNSILQVTMGHKDARPSVKFKLPVTNLSGYVGISMDIKNLGTERIAIEANCFSDIPGSLNISDGVKYFYRSMIVLNPSETDSLFIAFSRSTDSLPTYVQRTFSGMFGLPGGFVRRKINLDLTHISHVAVFVQKTRANCNISIDNIRAVGKYELPNEEELNSNFFPFVDRFGQYKYKNWPDKTRSEDDILKQKQEEEKELEANPGSSDWNQYGGWQNGPSLKATGHFRTEKYQGKWWLVDPNGRLFWSQGLNIVSNSQRTPVRYREKYFDTIPQNGDFYRANLLVKYGNSWDLSPRDSASKTVHKRLRSWGINTIAANSDPYLYSFKKTPYTIEIRSGISNPLPDSINEASFKKIFASRLQRSDIVAAANDPWCIGYFVDNELSWPDKNNTIAINKYFRIVQEELRKFAPNKLYLGCRINSPNFNRVAFEASAKYCDAISINHYDYNLSDFKETKGLDKPLIIGEFHYGALDRGLLHTGLRSVSNQDQRARVYKHFVEQGLENEFVVGAHWFQYVDQVCTGRDDGENYQIGFVDICDRPYPEMVKVARELSSKLYNYRLNGIKNQDNAGGKP